MTDLNPIDAILDELREYAAGNKPLPEGCREGMHWMGDGGRLVEAVVRTAKPRTGLEIGTSSGYSALCAMRGAICARADFYLTTVDFDPIKADWARDNFRRAGVDGNISLVVEDGLTAAQRLSGPWDYLLLDAAKSQNLSILQAVISKLNPGAVILTDNAVTHRMELAAFTQFVRNHPRLISGLFEIGNGVEVSFSL